MVSLQAAKMLAESVPKAEYLEQYQYHLSTSVSPTFQAPGSTCKPIAMNSPGSKDFR